MPDFLPIGIIHSSLRTKGAPPIQSSFSQAAGSIEIFPEYREGLRDIGVFTHIIVLYHFHQSDSQALSEKPLVDGNANHGIFATRHFNRPNPIGISYVALTGIEDGNLSVKGMDILDGTPVLDIKPYIPAFDAIPGAGSGWVTEQHVEQIRAAGVGVPSGLAGSDTRRYVTEGSDAESVVGCYACHFCHHQRHAPRSVLYSPLPVLAASLGNPEIQFASINPRFEHVAKTLGCTEAGAFFQVTLPMARHGLLAGTVVTWSKAMGEFGAVLMLAGATTMRTETLPIALYLNISTGDVDLAVAAATILILISLAALCCVEYLDRDVNVF